MREVRCRVVGNNQITIYRNQGRSELESTRGFLTEVVINEGDVVTLAEAVSFNNVLAKYKDGHRKGDNFVCANCILADIDNDNTEIEDEWVTHEDVIRAMPNVSFYWYYSRNHMKEKNGRPPRPKYHFVYPTEPIANAGEYTNLMKQLIKTFVNLSFDKNVCSPAQLNFAVQDAKVSYVRGEMTISNFLKVGTCNEQIGTAEEQINIGGKHDKSDDTHQPLNIIPIGERNTRMSRFAASVLKRYGDKDDKAYQQFIKEAQKCVPPLEDRELKSVFNSTLKFFKETIETDPNYIQAEQYSPPAYNKTLKPLDFTDLGQAQKFKEVYGNRVQFSESTKFLFYTGKVWVEDDLKVHGLAQELTEAQLKEARLKVRVAQEDEDRAVVGGNEALIQKAKDKLKYAIEYRKYALGRRNTLRISATLKEVQPLISVTPQKFDANEFYLNTPNGTVDLRSGKLLPHNACDFCTKITAVEPSNSGSELFNEFLNTITCEDEELKSYLQIIAGMAAIGRVYCENVIFAYGKGKNGKSTLFNLLSNVMGEYSGSLSAEVLTVKSRKNKGPEYAELKGKRLVIAAELSEGNRLDTAIVKHLCSTDKIVAEQKYRRPFSFTPSHTLVLYTNHLPRIGTSDVGTLRRLIVVPFNATIKADSDKKNFAEELFEKAGGAVLSWIIEGAKKFVKANYSVALPDVVKQAISEYQEENNWLKHYISDNCEIGEGFTQKAGDMYAQYRKYCEFEGEYVRSNTDFKSALEGAGYQHRKKTEGAFYYGIRLKEFSIPKVEISKILPNIHNEPKGNLLGQLEEDVKNQNLSDNVPEF